jgi:hypothetical protein
VTKILINPQDIACTIAESLATQFKTKSGEIYWSLENEMIEDQAALIKDIANNIAQAVMLCGDELPSTNDDVIMRDGREIEAWVSRGSQGGVNFTRAGIANTSIEVSVDGHHRLLVLEKLIDKLKSYALDAAKLYDQIASES